jgi:integrase
MGNSQTDSATDPDTTETETGAAPVKRDPEGDPEGGLPAEETKRKELRDHFSREHVRESTRKVYLRHWRAFASWCEEDGRTPLPATTETVQDFALSQGAGGLSLSTIRGRLAAIGYYHRRNDHEDPTASETIENTMEHLADYVGTPAEKKKALRSEDISDMVRALPGSPEGGSPEGDRSGTADARRLRGIRDRALILVGFAGALRRSELAGMEASWLSFNPKGFEVEIPRSKGDAEGEGQIVGISRGESVDLCPVRALRRWMGAPPTGIEEGPIFRSVPNHGLVAPDERAEPISGQAVADAVKRAAENVGLPAEKISGHSLRRGHLTTAARNGAELVDLQKQARHADPRTTAEYVEDANRMETNTSRHLGL